MKREYHIILKDSSRFFVYADSFVILKSSSHKIVKFIDKKHQPIMSINVSYIDEIFRYKSLYSIEHIIEYKYLPFPDVEV